MLKIGVTGQNGFIGRHLLNSLSLEPNRFSCVEFKRSYFEDANELDDFVKKCDVIVHLAAVNRHSNLNTLYEINIDLVNLLIASLERTHSKAHVIISSSSQEGKFNLYGESKKKGRELLERWSLKSERTFTGLIIPNVFGPFGIPFHNSVVSTFSHQLINGLRTNIETDRQLKIIYVTELVSEIIEVIKERKHEPALVIKHTSEIKVSQLLSLLQSFKSDYLEKGEIPNLMNKFQLDLFNTFRSHINLTEKHFPVKLFQHNDTRGTFVEIIRLGIGGQVSFSSTLPGITRGNHFHTRKIERFSVLNGKALIQLRKIDSKETYEFQLEGDNPSYVDMPIWFTHNIINIGEEILYTIFWINEKYDPKDPDTYPLEIERRLK